MNNGKYSYYQYLYILVLLLEIFSILLGSLNLCVYFKLLEKRPDLLFYLFLRHSKTVNFEDPSAIIHSFYEI
jgi:hypothetical protein